MGLGNHKEMLDIGSYLLKTVTISQFLLDLDVFAYWFSLSSDALLTASMWDK